MATSCCYLGELRCGCVLIRCHHVPTTPHFHVSSCLLCKLCVIGKSDLSIFLLIFSPYMVIGYINYVLLDLLLLIRFLVNNCLLLAKFWGGKTDMQFSTAQGLVPCPLGCTRVSCNTSLSRCTWKGLLGHTCLKM